MVANDRHERIRELRGQGLSVGDIAERLSVSRQTVWRACRDAEPVPPTPTPHTPDGNGNGHVDLETARALGLGVLVDKARSGSVSAASSVFKTASAELRANKCQGHIPKDRVIAALHAQFNLWVGHLQGPFVRRLLLEYDVDPGHLESLVEDAIDGITRELNARFESESAAEDKA